MTAPVLFLGVTIVLLLLVLVYLYRIAVGPTIFDRLLGLSGFGTKTTLVMLLIGAVYDRLDMFVDIGLAYALLSFVGSLAAARYFERGGSGAMTVLLAVVLGAGVFFHAVAAIGVLRLPDFYTRLHAVSKAETLGVILTTTALALWAGPTVLAVKVGLVAVFLFLAGPTSTHAIARAALRTGLRAWSRSPAAPVDAGDRRS